MWHPTYVSQSPGISFTVSSRVYQSTALHNLNPYSKFIPSDLKISRTFVIAWLCYFLDSNRNEFVPGTK